MPVHLTRTEEEKVKLAAEVIDYLNEALRLDPKALWSLAEARVYCNQELSDHPTIQVSGTVGTPSVGLLGILNGLVGVRADGWGYITAVYESIEGPLLRFEPTAEKPRLVE